MIVIVGVGRGPLSLCRRDFHSRPVRNRRRQTAVQGRHVDVARVRARVFGLVGCVMQYVQRASMKSARGTL